MRRYNKFRESHSVTLFPFLAVLICTFGVLIVLLVIVVKAAENQAELEKHEVDEAHEVEHEELASELQLQQIRVAGLKSTRPDLVKRLQQARQLRVHLQSSIETIKDQAGQLQEQIRLVNNEVEIVDLARANREIDLLQRQLESENAALAQQRENAKQGRPTRYSIVPHEGAQGTHRRPIYIECLKDKLVIQPYQIELSAQDFIRPIVANNPLDAALISVREYFLANKLNEVGQTPYPLLVVRPQGAESYSVARRAIRSWDEEFGYELIAAEKELDFGKPDPQIGEKIKIAIAAARKRQRSFVSRKILENAPHRQTGQVTEDFEIAESTGQQLRASSRLGGFVAPGGRIAKRREAAEHRWLPDALEAGENVAQDSELGASSDVDSAAESAGATGSAGKITLDQNNAGNWALPGHKEGAVAYRRPVVVTLRHRQILVRSSRAPFSYTDVPISRSPQTTVEELVGVIQGEIENWGVAGANGYWKPELVVEVGPGERVLYRQIAELLRGSGIEIREAPRK